MEAQTRSETPVVADPTRVIAVCVSDHERSRAFAEQLARAWRGLDGNIVPASNAVRVGDERVDAMAVIGGDGFLIVQVHRYGHHGVPFVGWNTGSVGFHLNARPETDAHLTAQLKVLRRGIAIAFDYALLTAWVRTRDGRAHALRAFNEFTIERMGRQSARFQVQVHGEPLGMYVGDGMIVSTPQGSTAYCNAAHGPVVDWRLPSLTLIPVNPIRAQRAATLPFPVVLHPKSIVEVLVSDEDMERRPVRIANEHTEIEHVRSVAMGYALDTVPPVRILRFADGSSAMHPVRAFPRRIREVFGADQAPEPFTLEWEEFAQPR